MWRSGKRHGGGSVTGSGGIVDHKIKKVVRFRVSEIDTWVEQGGKWRQSRVEETEGELFADGEGEAGAALKAGEALGNEGGEVAV